MTETNTEAGAPQFSLIAAHTLMGKFANNTEKHGEEYAAGFFQAPFEAELTQEQLDALMGKYFWRSLYVINGADPPTPVEGFKRCAPLALADHYEECDVALLLSGDRMVQFGNCKVKNLTLQPQHGGLTTLRMQIYMDVGIGPENLLMQEHQHREVGLEVCGKLALKASHRSQQQLPLGDPPASQSGDQAATENPDPPPAGVIDGTTAESRAARRDQLAGREPTADDPQMSGLGRQIQNSARERDEEAA